MNKQHSRPARPPAAAAQANNLENVEAAWESVLDCGAPGPGRQAPALFYQAASNGRAKSVSRPGQPDLGEPHV